MHFISLHLPHLATLTPTQRRCSGERCVFAAPRRIFCRANFVVKVRSMCSGLNAARECLCNRPMAPSSIQERPEPQQACECNWQQKYHQIRNLSRQRLADASPPCFLSDLQSLPRSGYIFANIVYAESADTSGVISKWRTHSTSVLLLRHQQYTKPFPPHLGLSCLLN